MIAKEREEWVLERAFQRGALRKQSLCITTPQIAPMDLTQTHHYGPRIDSLIRCGRLDEYLVRQLLAEFAAQSETQDGAASPECCGPSPHENAEAPEAVAVPPALLNWKRYLVEGCIGRGGMGVVYRAYDPQLDRTVALKFMYGNNPRVAQRFQRESRAQARIRHSAVCQIYEVGEHAGHPYIAMEYLSGQPLHLAATTMTTEAKICVARDVALALQSAHSMGIIHRDIKPQNILVDQQPDGRWSSKVLDFGLARDIAASQSITESGAVVGTPAYMPPEQALGGAALRDRRADVYSLGAVLYHLLTGTPPFTGASLGDVLMQVLHEDPASPQQRNSRVPAALSMIVMKCLRKEAQLRYESAQALADELDRYLAGEPILAARWSWAYRLRRQGRRHRGLLRLGLVLALGLASVLTMTVRGQHIADRRARLAQELGREIERNDMYLRAAYMMPLHSLRREQDEVRTRLRRVEQQLLGMERPEAALAHLALGRGYLALREYEKAVFHLEVALRDGQDENGVHYSLGLALGAQYQLALREVERQGDPGWRAQRTQQLHRQYLEPAQSHLRNTRPSLLESPEYAAAVQAFFNKEYDLALRQAEAAHRKQPWRVESQKLIGDVFYDRAHELLAGASIDPAHAALVRAIESYQAAAAVARSDAMIHLSEADAWAARMSADMLQGTSPQAASEQALSACERVAAADSTQEGLYKVEYLVHFILSYYQLEHGQEPGSALAKALAAAQEGIAVNPRDPFFYDAAGTVLGVQSQALFKHGDDSSEQLNEGLAYLRQAVELNPNTARTWHDLASLQAIKLKRQLDRGEDATTELQAAIRAFAKARQLSPQPFASNENLFKMLSEYAQGLLRRGQPSQHILEMAQSWAAAATKYSPANFWMHQSMAELHAVSAEYAGMHQQSPDTDLAAAQAEIEAALRLNPRFADSYRTLARVYRLRAHYFGQKGEQPTALLSAGLAAVEHSLRINPADPEAQRERAAVVAEQRRWRGRR